MKTALLGLLIITVSLCGCAAYHNAWRTNGTVQVSIHAPDDLVGQPIVTSVDGRVVSTSTNLTETLSLIPKHNEIKIEMAGTTPFEQTVEVAGNGSSQALDVTLVKP
jgi:hypothetical protein